MSDSELILYQSEDGGIHINVQLEDEAVWLTQPAIIELFQSRKANISEHISHIYEEGELTCEATVRKFRTVQNEVMREIL